MKIIETEFTKELSLLLQKHNKSFESDKGGIYIVDHDCSLVATTESETASEDLRQKLIQIFRIISLDIR
jgi:hypothetical protein